MKKALSISLIAVCLMALYVPKVQASYVFVIILLLAAAIIEAVIITTQL